MNGRTDVIVLNGVWIVPGELYAVAREAVPVQNAERIGAGEIHAQTLDGDVIPKTSDGDDYHFPARHRTGLYSVQRCAEQMIWNLDHLYPPETGQREARSEVLAARREKMERWHSTLSQLIAALLDYTNQVKTWAVAAKSYDRATGAFALVQQLEALTYRPFLGWFERLTNDALHKGRYDEIITICDLIQLRHELERVVAPLSLKVNQLQQAHSDTGMMALMRASDPTEFSDPLAELRNRSTDLLAPFGPGPVLTALDQGLTALAAHDLIGAKKLLGQTLDAYDRLVIRR